MLPLNNIKKYRDFEDAIKSHFGERYLNVKKKWVTGGTEPNGYNSGVRVVPSEPEPKDPKEFIDILELFCPDITFLQFKRLELYNIWDEGSDYDSGYYGDTTYYATKTLNLRELFTGLKEIFCENE